MKPITKDEYKYMIKHGILISKHGVLEGYISGSKLKHGKSKAGFVEDSYYSKMLEMQNKQMVDAVL